MHDEIKIYAASIYPVLDESPDEIGFLMGSSTADIMSKVTEVWQEKQRKGVPEITDKRVFQCTTNTGSVVKVVLYEF